MRRKHTRKFKRQESPRLKRLGKSWRRPRGKDSKMRLGEKGKPSVPKIGHRGPRFARGVHPSGLAEVLVNAPEDVERVDPGKQAIRVASRVGRRKKEQILRRAGERKIKVLNPGGRKREAEHTEKASG
ncbi:MAG: 50S ribosomal protein L32e [Candidatus Hadarchaeota archaeon]|nr:50S ribosomal protein L32e [Candidatus Hadarchaeota archaeon]